MLLQESNRQLHNSTYLVITVLAYCGLLAIPLLSHTVSICSDFLSFVNISLSLLVRFIVFLSLRI